MLTILFICLGAARVAANREFNSKSKCRKLFYKLFHFTFYNYVFSLKMFLWDWQNFGAHIDVCLFTFILFYTMRFFVTQWSFSLTLPLSLSTCIPVAKRSKGNLFVSFSAPLQLSINNRGRGNCDPGRSSAIAVHAANTSKFDVLGFRYSNKPLSSQFWEHSSLP